MSDADKIREQGRLKKIEEIKIDLAKLRFEIQHDAEYVIQRIDDMTENIMSLQANGCNKIQEIKKGEKDA